jgi:hypothetical protein
MIWFAAWLMAYLDCYCKEKKKDNVFRILEADSNIVCESELFLLLHRSYIRRMQMRVRHLHDRRETKILAVNSRLSYGIKAKVKAVRIVANSHTLRHSSVIQQMITRFACNLLS